MRQFRSRPARRPRARPFLLPLLLALGLPLAAAAASQPGDEAPLQIPLWPGGVAPGSAGVPAAAQRIVARAPLANGGRDRYIEGVSRPYLAVYAPQRPNGRALLVIPGGGYQRIVIDKEGSTLAPTFAEQAGYTLFVLRYRLPGDAHADPRDAPLADAQRALRMIRSCAPGWALDPGRIAVLGFSAGGHLAARLATQFDASVYAPVDALDAASARPDQLLLGYPVISMEDPAAHPGSRARLLGEAPTVEAMRAQSLQYQVRDDMPPVFLLHAADDDVVPVENSLMFAAALRTIKVPVEMHIFPQWGHGFGVHAIAERRLSDWPQLALHWLVEVPKANPASLPQAPGYCPALDAPAH